MAAAGMQLLHLYDSIGQSSNDIRRMMKMAGFVLIKLGHGGESIGNTSAIDNRPKGLHCSCKRLEQCHFGVADLIPKTTSARSAPHLTLADTSCQIREALTLGLHDISDLHGRLGNKGRPRRCFRVASQAECPRQPTQPGRPQQQQQRISVEGLAFCCVSGVVERIPDQGVSKDLDIGREKSSEF